MPFISALDLVKTSESDQTDNLSVLNAVTVEINDDLYINFTSGQMPAVLDTQDRLNLLTQTAPSVEINSDLYNNFTAGQAPAVLDTVDRLSFYKTVGIAVDIPTLQLPRKFISFGRI